MEKKTGHLGKDKDRDIARQMWVELSLAGKGKYIASYYGLTVIVVIFAVIVIIFFVSDICKKKTEDAFSVMVADMDLPEDITERMERCPEYWAWILEHSNAGLRQGILAERICRVKQPFLHICVREE